MNAPAAAKRAAARGRATASRRAACAPALPRLARAAPYSLVSSLGRLFQRPFATLLTVGVMALAIALPLALGLALGNLQRCPAACRSRARSACSCAPDVDAAQAERLADRTARAPRRRGGRRCARRRRACSEFRAAQRPRRGAGAAGRQSAADRAAGDAARRRRRACAAQLRARPEVELVQYDAVWRQRLSAWLGVRHERWRWCWPALLGLGVLLVVGNTIRLDIGSRAEEIAVVQLLGATDGFVRRPFLYLGAWYGLAAGACRARPAGARAAALLRPAWPRWPAATAATSRCAARTRSRPACCAGGDRARLAGRVARQRPPSEADSSHRLVNRRSPGMSSTGFRLSEATTPRVMVVDGSKVVRKMIEQRAARSSCRRWSSSAAKPARKPRPRCRPASSTLVTTALRLPDMDGLELARYLREHAPQAYIPIIVVSGDVQERLESRSFPDDVTDYFDKSLGFNALAAFIQGYVAPESEPGGEVLYVEDSRVVALATRRMLEKHGLTVIHVHLRRGRGGAPGDDEGAGPRARSRRRAHRRVPEGRSHRQGPARARSATHSAIRKGLLPVLVMTGDDNPANQTDLLRAGANDLVQKPIEERLLVTKLLFQLRVGRADAAEDRRRGAAHRRRRLSAAWREVAGPAGAVLGRRSVGDYLERPDMRALARFPARREGRRQAHLPARAADLRGARRHALRAGQGRDPRPGPVPRPRPGPRPVLLGAARRATCRPRCSTSSRSCERDLGLPRPDHGCLLPWARQGVLLLNAVLTRRGRPRRRAPGQGLGGLHRPRRRDPGREREGLVFMLWGSYAQAKGRMIDRAPALRAAGAAPLAAVGPPRLHRLRALFRRQPLPAGRGQGPDRLAPAAAAASCSRWTERLPRTALTQLGVPGATSMNGTQWPELLAGPALRNAGLLNSRPMSKNPMSHCPDCQQPADPERARLAGRLHLGRQPGPGADRRGRAGPGPRLRATRTTWTPPSSLVMSHLRFVVHVARGYQGYGLGMGDLIQEGNIGLMKAVKRFDPDQGVRLVSFAVHWIRAEMHEFILRNWRIVKVATTKAQRKLFFNLRKSKKRLGWMNAAERTRRRQGPQRVRARGAGDGVAPVRPRHRLRRADRQRRRPRAAVADRTTWSTTTTTRRWPTSATTTRTASSSCCATACPTSMRVRATSSSAASSASRRRRCRSWPTSTACPPSACARSRPTR